MCFDPRLHLIDFVVQTTPADEAFRAIGSDLQHAEVQVSVADMITSQHHIYNKYI